MENERSVKQNYLRAEIVDEGYDSEQFLNFLCSIKGEESADIDNWSLDELKEAVSNFITKFQQNTGTTNSTQRTDSQGGDINNSTHTGSVARPDVLNECKDSSQMPKDVI